MLKAKIVLLSLVMVGASNALAVSPNLSISTDLGRTDAHKFCDGLNNCDRDNTSLRANIGYRLDNNWTMEIGYTSFGTLIISGTDNFNSSQKANAWTLSGVMTLPKGESFELIGRLGIARYETDNRGTAQGISIKNYQDMKPYVGAGVNFKIAHQLRFRLEYQIYMNISRADGSYDNVQGLYTGASYNF